MTRVTTNCVPKIFRTPPIPSGADADTSCTFLQVQYCDRYPEPITDGADFDLSPFIHPLAAQRIAFRSGFE
jgi:hypothetical protein